MYTHIQLYVFVYIGKFPGAYSANLTVVTSDSYYKDGEEAILHSLYNFVVFEYFCEQYIMCLKEPLVF